MRSRCRGVSFGELDGTSMATPLVSGLAALMWSRHIGFTNQKIKDCLISSAVKLGPGAFDNAWGNGRVNAEAALRCGDLVVQPSIVGPTCLPSRILVQCPSRIVVQCPSTFPVACPTLIPRQCPTLIPAQCPSRIVVQCPSRPPVLCPISRVPVQCPSRPPVLCPTTVVPAICGGPSQVPATCPIPIPIPIPIPDPGPVIGPGPIIGPGPGPARPAGDTAEQWYGEGEYFVIDDAGNAQPFPPAESAAASPETAEWYWLDEEGGVRYWSGGGA